MHTLNKFNLGKLENNSIFYRRKIKQSLDLARRLEISFPSHVLHGPNQLNQPVNSYHEYLGWSHKISWK